jgi:tetratricopeptide (TPR) repeat protein
MRLPLAVLILALIGAAAAPVRAQSSDRFEALVGLARVKRDAGDARAARGYFEQARRLKPFDSSLEAEYFWVLAEVAPAEAVAVGHQLLQQRPAADDVRERTIAAALASGQEATALGLAQAGARREPGRALWHRYVASSLARQGKPAEAVRAWQAAVDAAGAHENDRVGLALALEAAGEYRRALVAWDAVSIEHRRDRADWERSRLRALAHAGPAVDAAVEVDAWVAAHVDDREMREALVDLWSRAGDPARARVALQPLLAGTDRHRWMRRDMELARATGLPAIAIERLEQMATDRAATRVDLLTLIELLIDRKTFTRAGDLIRSVSATTSTCDLDLLPLIDRIPGAQGTSWLIDHLRGRDCRRAPAWTERGIERSTAEGRHAEALALIDTLPTGRRDARPLRRLAGQLQLWTGDAASAARTLAPLVDGDPADLIARDALVDAYRGVGNPYAAWSTALPIVDAPDTPAARLVTLAELALEADRPQAVDALLSRAPAAAAPAPIRLGLQGRALIALGRPADAVRVLSSVPLSELEPPAVLALVDGLHTTRGVDAALGVARSAPLNGTATRDVVARRGMLELLAGSNDATPASRADLAALDPTLPAIVDAEVALAQERPFDALAALATLPPGAPSGRVADLRVTALAGSGNLQAALAELQLLRQQRPAFTPFILREAELAWRLDPGRDALAAVLALPGQFPGNWHAATTAARALAFEKRHDDVIAVLGGMGGHEALPIEGRVLMARSLFAAGRAAAALETLVDLQLRGPAEVFRAELIARVEGAEAGERIFRVLAASPDASADLFLAWAALTPDRTRRVAVLEEGARRFAGSASLFESLANARAAAGDRDGSLVAAGQAVAIDAGSGEAWFQLLAGTVAVRPADDLARLIGRFTGIAATRPALAIVTADRTAALVRSASDPLLNAALGWLGMDIADPSLQVSRDLARVRLLAAGQRWFEALQAADDAVVRHPGAAPALRLRADVLSWAGRHDEGIAAYDDYLAVVPADVDARRQQARVAGWAGRFADARRYYDALRARSPGDAAIAAEAEAKTALFEGRWRRAVAAYERWLAVEPGNGEARFELAEALRAAGDVERADATLSSLAPDGGHRLAEAARDREAWRREPSVAMVAGLSSANGYEDQRLLSLRTTGAEMRATFGAEGRTTVTADATSVQAASRDVTRAGYQLGVGGSRRLSRTAAVDALVSLWDVSGPGAAAVQASATAAWSPADRWTLQGGAGRELLLENIATIDRRLAATGGFLGAAFESPSASFGIRSSWQRLSDGNRRARLSVSATRAVSDRWSHVRVIAWADVLDHARATGVYFAPERFLRIDGGLEYTHLFSQPRFRGDRMDQIAVGYLIGTDSRGTLYQHPSVRMGWEMSSSMALSLRADVIRSRSYNEQSLLVSLHLIGGAFSR